MSFATIDKNLDLREACRKASAKGIMMLASSHDEGKNLAEAFPGSFEETVTITALDDFGVQLRPSTQNYDFGISAEAIPAGVVPFLTGKSDDSESGSSVATAIAAGLSSLILSCDRLAQEDRPHKSVDQKDICVYHLKEMAQTSPGKTYVMLEKFGGIDGKLKDGLDINVKQVLTEWFATADYDKVH